jgi:heme/copper-type cytochrome/quinol oxidase subunit 2
MPRVARMPSVRRPFVFTLAGLVLAVGAVTGLAQTRKTFEVTARKYEFRVAGVQGPEIRVPLGAQVKITFTAEDIAHSFTTLDDNHYRINRRGEPGKPITFEFRADKAGRFPFGCTLTIDERCAREMRGVLIVE